MRIKLAKDLDKELDWKLPAPEYKTAGACALDLYNYGHCINLWDDEPATKIRTGISIELPKGHCARVLARSSVAMRGVYFYEGLIDEDYRGEIFITAQLVCHDLNLACVAIEKGERIAQLLIQPYKRVKIEVVDVLSKTKRGSGGFGSTGAK